MSMPAAAATAFPTYC